jgi:two-component system, NtrC family, response regulator AtoC
MILTDGPVIRPEHCGSKRTRHRPKHSPEDRTKGPSRSSSDRRSSTLANVGGNRRLAATKLGIGLRTLYEKLKRYDLR